MACNLRRGLFTLVLVAGADEDEGVLVNTDELIAWIKERAVMWTELFVIHIRVGDTLKIDDHTYIVHVAHNNELVLGPLKPD